MPEYGISVGDKVCGAVVVMVMVTVVVTVMVMVEKTV